MYYPGLRVNRLEAANITGATIISIDNDTALISYDEGGQGWWPLSSLVSTIDLNTSNFTLFYNTLLLSYCYNAALTQVMAAPSPAPSAALAILISAIQDCLNGRPNPPALQAAVTLFLSQITLDTSSLQELQLILNNTGLNQILTLPNTSPPSP